MLFTVHELFAVSRAVGVRVGVVMPFNGEEEVGFTVMFSVVVNVEFSLTLLRLEVTLASIVLVRGAAVEVNHEGCNVSWLVLPVVL